MTREDIIKMAWQAGHAIRNIDGEDEVMDGDNYHIQTELIECFAHFVAAAEREECAKVCEEVESRADDLWNRHAYPEDQGMSMGASQCAAAIRARGEK